MCIRHINKATRGEFGPNGRKLWNHLFLTSDIVKILIGLSSCPPRQHEAACFGADTRNGEEDLSKHTSIFRCRIKSREEAGSGITETERAFPLAVLAGPEPHILVRQPVAAGNSPSRHTNVYRCSIEGREEAGVNVETSL
jgi:hypothetical protein